MLPSFAGFAAFYQLLQVSTRTCLFLQGLPVLQVSSGVSQVLPVSRFCRFLQGFSSFTGFLRFLPEFYWAFLVFTGFCRGLPDFAGFCRVLPGEDFPSCAAFLRFFLPRPDTAA